MTRVAPDPRLSAVAPAGPRRSPPPVVKERERDQVLAALAAGVTPPLWRDQLAVGREAELAAVERDLTRVSRGGAALRLVLGPYGSGKTFFLARARALARKLGLATCAADLTLSRRLHGRNGEVRALFAALVRSLSTAEAPGGGALEPLLRRFAEALPGSGRRRTAALDEARRQLEGLPQGAATGAVLLRHVQATLEGDARGAAAALRWLAGELVDRAEARRTLGVGVVIDDSTALDQLKLLPALVRLCGCRGLLVTLDEVELISHRVAGAPARAANYERLLELVNHCLQGEVAGLGLALGGTDAFFHDPRRGVLSHPALASRLAPAGETLDGPLLPLSPLSSAEQRALLRRLSQVHGGPAAPPLPEAAIDRFLAENESLPDPSPRALVRRFIALLQRADGPDPTLGTETAAPPAEMADDDDDELRLVKVCLP